MTKYQFIYEYSETGQLKSTTHNSLKDALKQAVVDFEEDCRRPVHILIRKDGQTVYVLRFDELQEICTMIG